MWGRRFCLGQVEIIIIVVLWLICSVLFIVHICTEVVGSLPHNFPFVHITGDHLPLSGGCNAGALRVCDSKWVRVIWGFGGCLLLLQEDCVPHLVLSVGGPPVFVPIFLLIGFVYKNK